MSESKKPIPPEVFAEEMRQIMAEHDGDFEEQHIRADALMCALLIHLGYGEAVALFEEMEKWYA